MAPNSHNDINLLPHDLKRRRKKAVKVENLPDYTSPEKRSKEKGKSIFSGLFSFKHKEKKEVKLENIKPHELPKGKPLPSAMFLPADRKEKIPNTIEKEKEKNTEIKEIPKIENIVSNINRGVSARNLMSMHNPNFVQTKEIIKTDIGVKDVIPAKSAEFLKDIRNEEPKKSKKFSWYKKLFLREKKEKPWHEKKIETDPKSKQGLPEKNTIAYTVATAGSEKENTQTPVHRISSFDVNLLSGEYSRSFSKEKPLFTLLSFIGATFVLIVVIFTGLNVYNKKSENKIENVETISKALEETIATYKSIDQEDSKLRQKIDIVEKLLDNHISWYSFLDKLENETIPEITYLDIAASSEGAISITALAKDYTSLARQMTVFSKVDWIKNLDITSATLTEETATMPSGVSFDMQIFINKEILYSTQ